MAWCGYMLLVRLLLVDFIGDEQTILDLVFLEKVLVLVSDNFITDLVYILHFLFLK
jgi:hypothetical protein